MPSNAEELERLFITLLADDSKLEASFRKVIARSKQVATEVGRAFEQGASKGFVDSGAKVEASARRQAKAQEEVGEAVKRAARFSLTLRREYENGIITMEEFKDQANELRSSLLAQAEGMDRTSKEYDQAQLGAQRLSTALATVDGRTSKLGISANIAAGTTRALAQNFSALGPAGMAAARATDVMRIAFAGFAANGEQTTLSIGRLVQGFKTLAFTLPLIATAAAGAALAGLVRMGNAAAEVADKIDKGSQAAGLSAEAYQELRYAFDQNGISAERFDLAVQSLNRRLGLAAQGNATYAKEYDRLGIAIRDAHGNVRDTEDVLTDAIDAISRLPNAAEQAASASVLFGDDVGKKLVPVLKQGVTGINDLRDAAREMGLVISGGAVLSLVEYKDSMATLAQQFETAKVEIVAGFIPVMTDLLIPLLQNTVVPALQTVAQRVQTFGEKLRDTGPAGVEFRNGLAETFAPLVALVGYVQAAGASLDILNLKFQLSGAQGNQFLRNLDQAFLNSSSAVREFFGFSPHPQAGPSPVSARVEQLTADLAEAESALADALYLINNPGAITAEWLKDIVRQVNEATGVLGGLGESANDAFDAVNNIPPPPEGSLAALRAELQAAQRDFELAVTDEARTGAVERIRIKEAEIASITALMNPDDPLQAARVWTQRLAAEYENGLKSAREVFDLIFPRLEELREEARTALVDFGFDSAEYQAVVGKIQLLEALFGRVRDEVSVPLTLDVSVGTVGLTAPEVRAEVLAEPLANAAFLIHKYATETTAELESFRSDYEDWGNNVALASASAASAFNAPTEALRIFMDTLEAMADSGASLTELEQIIRNSPLFAMGLIMGAPGDPTAGVPDAGLLEAALEEQRDAYAAVQAAMTEDQLRQAGIRLAAADEEVERLREIYASAAGDAPDIDQIALVREDLTTRLEAAGVAAEVFGTKNELAADKMRLLEDAIRRIIALDPAADVSDLVTQWEALAGGADAASQALATQESVTRSLAAAQAELDALTGNLPDKYEQLRIAFVSAAAAGKITVEQLEDFLRIIRELEQAAGAAGAIGDWAKGFDIAGQISGGLTDALEGITSGDITGVLGGLTQVGAAIGTALGGPAVGALVQSIGGFIQTLPSLFQAISDIFTGDSPARRELAASLATTVASAFKSGILDGLKGGEDWQEQLREGVTDAVLGAVIDAFIQAAIIEAIFAPFLETFTKLLHSGGVEEAFAFFDREFEGFLDEAIDVAEEFVGRARRFYRDSEDLVDVTSPTGTVELPTATVSVLAAPQWALELNTSAAVIGEAGTVMLEAANLMKATFSQPITVTTQSTRGIDAQRAA